MFKAWQNQEPPMNDIHKTPYKNLTITLKVRLLNDKMHSWKVLITLTKMHPRPNYDLKEFLSSFVNTTPVVVAFIVIIWDTWKCIYKISFENLSSSEEKSYHVRSLSVILYQSCFKVKKVFDWIWKIVWQKEEKIERGTIFTTLIFIITYEQEAVSLSDCY